MKQNTEHLDQMQQEVVQEVDNLKHTINEGRQRIAIESQRLDQARNDGFAQLQVDLEGIKADAKRATESAIGDHQQVLHLQEARCDEEIQKLEVIQSLHMTLIDAVEESKGAFVFNEVPVEQIEYRFYLDQVLDDSVRQNSGHNFLVVGSQTHLTQCQKKTTTGKKNQMTSQSNINTAVSFHSILTLDAVFQLENGNQFKNNGSRYFYIRLHHADLRNENSHSSLSGLLRQYLVQESPEHQVKIYADIQHCFSVDPRGRSNATTPKLTNNDESMTMQELEKTSKLRDGEYTVLVIQIAECIAEKHTNDADMLCEVQNAISTGQSLSNLLRFEALLAIGLSNSAALIQYWLQPRWSNKLTSSVPSPAIATPVKEHILYEMLQDPQSLRGFSKPSNQPPKHPQAAAGEVDFTHFEQMAAIKLNEFERRLWGELDQKQINQFHAQQQEIRVVRDEIENLQSQINDERATQDQLLSQLRTSLTAPNAPIPLVQTQPTQVIPTLPHQTQDTQSNIQ